MSEPEPDNEKLILDFTGVCPGDWLTGTAAIDAIHKNYPGRYLTDVRPMNAVFENNPHITMIEDGKGKNVRMQYPLVNKSNELGYSFLQAYTHFLSEYIQKPLNMTTNKPLVYLCDEEKQWTNQVEEQGYKGKFWLVNAGIKNDFTTKQWPYYQQLVDQTKDRIQWVQVGNKKHNPTRLNNVIDLVDQTDLRQLLRLCYHCEGGVGPVTLLQHACAAFDKPYLALLGGREPLGWVSMYPKQYTFHTMGALDCCKDKACWASRTVPLNDGSNKDLSLCKRPVLGLHDKAVPNCMAMITPDEVKRILYRLIGEG